MGFAASLPVEDKGTSQIILIARRVQDGLERREIDEVGRQFPAIAKGAVQIENAVPANIILLVQGRGDVIHINNAFRDCALSADLMDNQIAHSNIRAVNRNLSASCAL